MSNSIVEQWRIHTIHSVYQILHTWLFLSTLNADSCYALFLQTFMDFHMLFQLSRTPFLPLVHLDSNFETYFKSHLCQTTPSSAWFICLAVVFVVATLRSSSWVKLSKISLGPQAQASITAVSHYIVIVGVLVCLSAGLWVPCMGLWLSSQHPSIHKESEQIFLTNEWMADPYLITIWNISLSTQVEYTFLSQPLLISLLLILFHQWGSVLPTKHI